MYPETNILSWSLDGLFIDNSRFIQSGVVAVTFQFFKCFLLTPFLHTHTHTHTHKWRTLHQLCIGEYERLKRVRTLLSFSSCPSQPNQHSSCSCHPFHLLYWRGSTSLYWGIYLTFGLEILDRKTWALRFRPCLLCLILSLCSVWFGLLICNIFLLS